MKNFIIWIIIMGTVGYFGSKWYLHSEVSDGMDMAVLMMSPFATVDYDGVDSTLTGELTIEGIRVRVEGFSDELYIDRMGIDTPSFLSLLSLSDLSSQGPDAMPEYIGFIVEGLRIPSDADYYRDFYEFSLAAVNRRRTARHDRLTFESRSPHRAAEYSRDRNRHASRCGPGASIRRCSASYKFLRSVG